MKNKCCKKIMQNTNITILQVMSWCWCSRVLYKAQSRHLKWTRWKWYKGIWPRTSNSLLARPCHMGKNNRRIRPACTILKIMKKFLRWLEFKKNIKNTNDVHTIIHFMPQFVFVLPQGHLNSIQSTREKVFYLLLPLIPWEVFL